MKKSINFMNLNYSLLIYVKIMVQIYFFDFNNEKLGSQ